MKRTCNVFWPITATPYFLCSITTERIRREVFGFFLVGMVLPEDVEGDAVREVEK